MTTNALERPVKMKPFPRFCFNCRKQEVVLAVVPYSREFKYEDALYTVNIPNLETPRCRACNDISFDTHVDIQMIVAKRKLLHLLSGAQMRTGRDRLGLTQAELAKFLGVAESALANWEDDFALQPRTADNLMRVFFAFPEVRAVLDGSRNHASAGVLVG